MEQFLPFVLIIVVFYVFLIMPQMRRQKKEKAFGKALKKGDRIVTKSGMHGKVLEFGNDDSTVIIETSAGKIKFERSAISMEMSAKLNEPAKK